MRLLCSLTPDEVLARDHFRCVVTGTFDLPSLYRDEDLVRQCDELTAKATLLNACCIIGESVEQCIDVTPERGVDAVTRKVCHFLNLPLPSIADAHSSDGSRHHSYFGSCSLRAWKACRQARPRWDP